MNSKKILKLPSINSFLNIIENSDLYNKNTDKYEKIINLYHSICISYPRIYKLSKERKLKIDARLIEMENDISILEKIFKNMQNSKFLKGEITKWSANFDFVFKNSSNWIKILEGNYNDKQRKDIVNNGIMNIYELQKLRKKNG